MTLRSPLAVLLVLVAGAAACSSNSPSSTGAGSTTSAPASPASPSAARGASTFDLTFTGSASFHVSGTPSMCSIGSNGGFQFGLDGKTFAPIGVYFEIEAFSGPSLIKWEAPSRVGYLEVKPAGLTFSADHHDLTIASDASGSGGRTTHIAGTVHCA